MVFTNIQPFPTVMTPITNISPLTYRDASTFLEYLETIKQWLNETLVPDSNSMIDNAILEFQTGIANAEATVIGAKAGWQGTWDAWTVEKAAEFAAFQNSINTAFATFKTAVNSDYAAFVADIDARVALINNKSGPIDIQRITLVGPYEIAINPLWPTNQPIKFVLTQDANGQHVPTQAANIQGALNVNPDANATTDFTLIPHGDGNWKISQFSVDAAQANLIANRLDEKAFNDRSASLSRSQIEYADNAGWTDELLDLTKWETNGEVSGGFYYKSAVGSNAQRILTGLNTGNARVISSIKVVAAAGVPGSGLTLVGLTRNTTTDATNMITSGFFGIGVDETNTVNNYPGGDMTPALVLTPGTYQVEIVTTVKEIICTLFNNTGSIYKRWSYPRAEWGESYRVGMYNSDSRGTAGNGIGPVAARMGYVSANPRGTVETKVRWTRYAVNEGLDNTLIATPANYDSRKPQPWVIYAHGYGDTEENMLSQPLAIQPVINDLIDKGYAVAAGNFGGTSNWGNATAVTAMENLYRHLRDNYNVGPIVLLGHSMGGLVTLTTIARGVVPGIVGWVGIEAVASLKNMYNHPDYKAEIIFWYGMAADGSNYNSVTSGHDPLLEPIQNFRAVPMLMIASPDDTAVSKIANSDALANKLKPVQPDITVIAATGPHVDPSHFKIPEITAFIEKVTKG